jgi:hypothetical protein
VLDTGTRPADVAEEGLSGTPLGDSAARQNASGDNPGHTNRIAQLLNGEGHKLTPEQVSAFLAANHTNAESLLAAWRVGHDPARLKEAKERFPNDPRVQYAAIFRSDSPEERSQWALPDYLSALDDLKAGRTAPGVQELTAAVGKTGYQDYVLDSIQSAEEAYRSAGYPEAEAKLVASSETLLPQLAQLKQLGLSVVDLASSYRQAGDTASEQNVLQMAVHLGQQLDPNGPGGQFLINNLVGIAIQLNALKAMDPAGAYDSSGQTVQERIDQITQEKAAIRQAAQQTEGMWQNMAPEDAISLLDRQKLYGEWAALQWYLNKNGRPAGAGPN